MPPAAAVPIIWGAGIGAAGTLGAAAMGSRGASRAARYQTDASNRAAELEAKSAAEALAFAREQEAQRRKEFEQTQQRNYEIFLTNRKDLEPYRRLGAGSIASLARGIYGPNDRRPGTIGAMAGGR